MFSGGLISHDKIHIYFISHNIINLFKGTCTCPLGLSGKSYLIENKSRIDGENNLTVCDCNLHKFDYCEPLTSILCKCKQYVDGCSGILCIIIWYAL